MNSYHFLVDCIQKNTKMVFYDRSQFAAKILEAVIKINSQRIIFSRYICSSNRSRNLFGARNMKSAATFGGHLFRDLFLVE